MKATSKTYECPQAEVIEVENQGVLCASGGAATSPGTGGGTTNMNVQDGYDW